MVTFLLWVLLVAMTLKAAQSFVWMFAADKGHKRLAGAMCLPLFLGLGWAVCHTLFHGYTP